MLLTRRGLLLLLVAAPILAAATWFPVLRWLAAVSVAIALFLVAFDWFAAGPVTRFEVRRMHDNRLSLGTNNNIELSVLHTMPRPVEIQIRDEPPPAFETEQLILAAQIEPRTVWRGQYYVHPLRRGDYQFADINLRWTGPLALSRRQGVIAAERKIQVYPDLLGVKRFDLLLRQNRLQQLGLRNARLTGEGTEFERLREYRPDDEYRRINWKATARRWRPITIDYQTERSQNIIAVLDTGRMMQSPVDRMAKLDYAINATLLLAYVAAGVGDKVGLLTFAAEVQHFIAPRQGRGQFYRILERLYAIEAQPVEPDYGQGLGYLAYKQRRRALFIIFTDITGGESMAALVEHTRLLARHSLPLVVTISDPDMHEMAQSYPQNSSDVYQRAMAGQMLHERQVILENLRRQGVETLDAPANQLSPAVVSRYLELKRRSRL